MKDNQATRITGRTKQWRRYVVGLAQDKMLEPENTETVSKRRIMRMGKGEKVDVDGVRRCR